MTANGLFLALFSSAVVIAEQLLPAKTVAAEHEINYLGWTPKPTDGPVLGGHHGLRRRQNSLSNACGVLPDTSNTLTCDSGFCGFNAAASVFGCCTSTYTSDGETYLTGCGLYADCNDSTVGCDDACQSNTELGACTEAASPYCVKYTLYASGQNGRFSYSNYGCTTASGIGPITVLSVEAGVTPTISSSGSDSSSVSSSVSSSSGDISPASFSSTSSSPSSSSISDGSGPGLGGGNGGAGLAGTFQPFAGTKSSTASVPAPSSTSSAAAAVFDGRTGQYSLMTVLLSWILGML